MKQRTSRRWLIVALAAVVLIAVAIPVARAVAQSGLAGPGCPPNCMVSFNTPSIFRPASGETAQIDALFTFILTIAGIIFVLVEGMLLLAVLRFRNRKAETAMQFHGNTKLEVAWTMAPAVILAVLLGFTLRTMGQVKAVTPGDALHVKAIGHQWWWEFRYPDLNIVTANEMVVPVNTVVEVAIESVDVEHGFWVPELFGKVDAVPGYTTRARFTPTEVRADYFGGQCTQFCGVQHAQMRFAVVVRTAQDFQAWAAHMQSPPGGDQTGDAATGRDLLLKSQCIGCHTIEGTAAAGQVGPNLSHIGGRGFIAGGVLANTPENLKAWISNPQAIKPGTLMPNLGLAEDQVNSLVAYLETLK